MKCSSFGATSLTTDPNEGNYQDSPDDSHSVSNGDIIGIVIGVIVFVGIAGILAYAYFFKNMNDLSANNAKVSEMPQVVQAESVIEDREKV